MAVDTSKTPKIVRNMAKIDQNEKMFDTKLAFQQKSGQGMQKPSYFDKIGTEKHRFLKIFCPKLLNMLPSCFLKEK